MRMTFYGTYTQVITVISLSTNVLFGFKIAEHSHSLLYTRDKSIDIWWYFPCLLHFSTAKNSLVWYFEWENWKSVRLAWKTKKTSSFQNSLKYFILLNFFTRFLIMHLFCLFPLSFPSKFRNILHFFRTSLVDLQCTKHSC